MCDCNNWLPIAIEPKHEPDKLHSIPLLVCCADYGVQLGQYNPFYKGHSAEEFDLWRVDNFGYAIKPTHWQPLPAPPQASGEA